MACDRDLHLQPVVFYLFVVLCQSACGKIVTFSADQLEID